MIPWSLTWSPSQVPWSLLWADVSTSEVPHLSFALHSFIECSPYFKIPLQFQFIVLEILASKEDAFPWEKQNAFAAKWHSLTPLHSRVLIHNNTVWGSGLAFARLKHLLCCIMVLGCEIPAIIPLQKINEKLFNSPTPSFSTTLFSVFKQ